MDPCSVLSSPLPDVPVAPIPPFPLCQVPTRVRKQSKQLREQKGDLYGMQTKPLMSGLSMG